jgi:hypothetical protein
MSKVEQTRSIHATFDNLNQDADMLCLTGRECQRAHNGSGCLSGSSGPCRRCIGEDLVRFFFQTFPQLYESDIEGITQMTDVEGWYGEKQWERAKRP